MSYFQALKYQISDLTKQSMSFLQRHFAYLLHHDHDSLMSYSYNTIQVCSIYHLVCFVMSLQYQLKTSSNLLTIREYEYKSSKQISSSSFWWRRLGRCHRSSSWGSSWAGWTPTSRVAKSSWSSYWKSSTGALLATPSSRITSTANRFTKSRDFNYYSVVLLDLTIENFRL